MDKTQKLKIIKILLIATSIIFSCEIIFSIPVINKFFCNLITGTNDSLVYLVIWVIMFLQVTVLNIPAYVVLSASVSIGINTLNITYILVVITAYMSGCILAYWLGRKFGIKAIKWCAGSEEDYNKWSSYINSKGKWFYFITVLLPFFPDDILCLVAGSVKFNFGIYVLSNLIGRTIGLITMLLTMNTLGIGHDGFPFMIIIWAFILIGELILYFVIKRRRKVSKLLKELKDKIADLESKLAESGKERELDNAFWKQECDSLQKTLAEKDKLLNQYPYKNDVVEKQYEGLKNGIKFRIENNITNDWEQLYHCVDVLCEKHKARIRDIENGICNIEQLEKQLAEKDKEIEDIKIDLEAKDFNINDLLERRKMRERTYKKDKISFAVEQLEKVKEYIKESLSNGTDDDWDFALSTIDKEIDNQIEELKKEMK